MEDVGKDDESRVLLSSKYFQWFWGVSNTQIQSENDCEFTDMKHEVKVKAYLHLNLCCGLCVTTVCEMFKTVRCLKLVNIDIFSKPI